MSTNSKTSGNETSRKQRKSTLALHIAMVRSGHFRKNQDGATAIEYALIAAGVGVAVAATVWSLGTTTANLYQSLANMF